MCDVAQINGLSRSGTHGEYMVLRREAAVSIPKDVDPVAYAPFLCAGVTVFNSKFHITWRVGFEAQI